MEFVKQLVAFNLATGQSLGLQTRSPEEVSDLWILIANAGDEETLLRPLTPVSRIEYHKWVDKWINKIPGPAPEPEPEPAQEEIQVPDPEPVPVPEPVQEAKPETKRRRSKNVKSDQGRG